jgi:hypothetical protein
MDEFISNPGFFFNGMYHEKDCKQIRETDFKSNLVKIKPESGRLMESKAGFVTCKASFATPRS